MSLHLYSAEEQLESVEQLIRDLRQDQSPSTRRHVDVLKSMAADLRANLDRPHAIALGELEGALRNMKRSKGALGYDNGKMVAVAERLVRHWPFVKLALQHFGEETAE